ncbi:UNVERIFIED_CONTAM: hypothetical protein RMT77_013742 [Armadillidium vulgare]
MFLMRKSFSYKYPISVMKELYIKLFNYHLQNESYNYLSKRYLMVCCPLQRTKETMALVTKSYFDTKNKNKETFLAAINKFREQERLLRGHIEFIYSALNYLEEFGVEKELEVYKSLLDIMPKGKMVPTNIFQEEFFHYPKHQECAVDVLEKMDYHGVMGDSELHHILFNTFGRKGKPVLKFARMMYWLPKFKGASPWPLPEKLPSEALELAKLAISQINCVDPASKITVMETKEVEDSIDDTWIVSAISPSQQELLYHHSASSPLKVEGPFGVMLYDQRISYFVLRADPKPPKPTPKRSDVDDVSSLFNWIFDEGKNEYKELIVPRTVHEQEDGTIMATCATGTSSKDSLLSWIRLLEKTIPPLASIPILFVQSSPIGEIIDTSNGDGKENNTSSTSKLDEP